MKKLLLLGLLSYISLIYFVSCSVKEGEYFYGALGLDETRVIISGSVAGQQHISMYDGDGNFVKKLYDYTTAAGTPRGMSKYGVVGFVIAVDVLDQIDLFGLDGTRQAAWGLNNQVTGAFYDMTRSPNNDYYYVIDGNSIERFDSLGNRIPLVSATPYIATSLGGCTLSLPTSLAINSAGQLVAVNNTGNTLVVYDLTSTAACSTSVAFANNPRAVLAHSDGSLYIVTQGAAQETLWRATATGGSQTSLFANNIAILQDGFAMAELPNGNILVSSTGTDSIVEFQTDGTFVRNFAKDANTNDVFGILVFGGSR